MLNQIKGLHHVTSLASSAPRNNAFFTDTLGLRRVKKTVNFDAPDVYHLYYGDEVGSPGSVMTYFPFPQAARGRPGTGEGLHLNARLGRGADRTGEPDPAFVRIDVEYLGELRCRSVHAPSGNQLLTDAPVDNQGKGEAFSPTDLVATALATCVLTTMGIVAARHGWDLAGSHASVEKAMVNDPHRRIGRLELHSRTGDGQHRGYGHRACRRQPDLHRQRPGRLGGRRAAPGNRRAIRTDQRRSCSR